MFLNAMNFKIKFYKIHLMICFHLIHCDSIFDWFLRKELPKLDERHPLDCGDGINFCSFDLKFGHLNESYSRTLQDLILINDDLPNECRTDICFSTDTVSFTKGSLSWPETTVGERYVQKCLYCSKEVKYAYHDCLYSTNNETIWTNLNVDSCPQPLFADEIESMQIIYKFESPNCSHLMTSFRNLNEIHEQYPTHPIFPRDYDFITKLFVGKIKTCLTEVKYLQREAKTIHDFLDMLFGRNYEQHDMQIFIKAIEVLKDSFVENFAIQKNKNNVALYEGQNMMLVRVAAEHGRFNHFFNIKGHGMVDVSFNWDVQYIKSTDVHLHVFYRFKLRPLVKWINEPEEHETETEVESSIENERLFQRYSMLKFQNKIREMLSPLVYINHSQHKHVTKSQKTASNTYPISVYFEDSEIKSKKNILCSNYPHKKYIKSRWKFDCKTTIISPSSVKCDCVDVGFIAIVTEEKLINVFAVGAAGPTEDIAFFLGFPHNYELYLAGMILRAVSIAALFFTIVSYVSFKKTRKGVPTHILLNLCFSLICLLVVLYVAEQRSNIKRECRIYNILRYYFIFVSLMWNGIEAHNMYRMLVKVFNSHKRHFVRLAAFISWGTPFLFVSSVLLLDYKAFDGVYTECTFGCSLRPWTMYLAWLLPMSVIILHNLIVYVMVVRNLCQERPAEMAREQDKENISSRLCGAFGVLVLLGVPWLLSAFGVLKSRDDAILHFQGVVGVLFVVFVSLQGLFIFLFHCARNSQIRSHWWSTITGSEASKSSKDSKSSRLTKSNMLNASNSSAFDKRLNQNPQ